MRGRRGRTLALMCLWMLAISLVGTGCERRRDSCFAEGTLIATPEGPVPIEDLHEGDVVWSMDPKTQGLVTARISKTFRHEGRIVEALSLPGGGILEVTDEHPVYRASDPSFVPAAELAYGDELLFMGANSTLRSMALGPQVKSSRVATVYNLTVEGTHTYFAGGVLVHNKSPSPPDAEPVEPIPSPTEGCPREIVDVQTDCTRYNDLPDDAPDGGEVRIENLIDIEGNRKLLASAHFFRGQFGQQVQPTITSDPSSPLECHWVGGTGGEGATLNPSPERIWPFGDDSDAIGITASFALGGRNYFRVGDSVELTADNDELPLFRRERGLSGFFGGLSHNIYYESDRPEELVGVGAFGGPGPNAEGTFVDIFWAGGQHVWRTLWKHEPVPGEEEREVDGLFIPPRPLVTSIGGVAARFSAGSSDTGSGNAPASVTLDTTKDLVIDYSLDDQASRPHVGVLAFYQEAPSFEVTHYCVFDHTDAVTVPQSIYAELAPTGIVTLSRMAIARRTINGENRVDLVGLATTSASYTFAEAPPP